MTDRLLPKILVLTFPLYLTPAQCATLEPYYRQYPYTAGRVYTQSYIALQQPQKVQDHGYSVQLQCLCLCLHLHVIISASCISY